MTERMDHAAKAANIVKGTSAFNDELLIAKAQVHATLALVEQARIANQIVLAGWADDAGLKTVTRALDDLREDVAADVWKGLGL